MIYNYFTGLPKKNFRDRNPQLKKKQLKCLELKSDLPKWRVYANYLCGVEMANTVEEQTRPEVRQVYDAFNNTTLKLKLKDKCEFAKYRSENTIAVLTLRQL